MKRVLWCLSLCLAAAGHAALAPAISWDRYQVILDRKPFGVVSAPAAGAGSAAESFAKNLRVSALLEAPSGVRVGFINTQNNKDFSLSVGEQNEEGLELVSANFKDEEAVLRKDGVTAVVKLQSGDGKGPPPGPAAPPPMRMMPPDARLSYSARRLARQQMMTKPPPPTALTGEKLEQYLRDYQMQVIREGLPALPIPLTPDMDAQLVREGVLPAQK